MSSDHIPLHYVDCDIPAGVTLTEWRRDRDAAAREERQQAREARAAARRRRLPRLALRPALRPRFA